MKVETTFMFLIRRSEPETKMFYIYRKIKREQNNVFFIVDIKVTECLPVLNNIANH